MELIYNIIEFILPFSFMEYDFMKNALLAIFVISNSISPIFLSISPEFERISAKLP
jgi:hypothetical protein